MHSPIAIVLLIATTLLFEGCGQQGGKTAEPVAHTPPAQEETPSTSTEPVPAVTLDNGQRWKANPETTTGIAHMVSVLMAYDPTSGDPNALKKALEEEFGLIFERCTMTGEAHEQLHNYLLPIHHQLRDFEANEAQRRALAEHLAAYGTYFE